MTRHQTIVIPASNYIPPMQYLSYKFASKTVRYTSLANLISAVFIFIKIKLNCSTRALRHVQVYGSKNPFLGNTTLVTTKS